MVKDVCSSPKVPNDTTICCTDTVPQRKTGDFSYIYSPSQMMVGKLFSFWKGPFSGDVSHPKSHRGLIQMWFQASFRHDGFSFLTVPKKASHKWPINEWNTSWIVWGCPFYPTQGRKGQAKSVFMFFRGFWTKDEHLCQMMYTPKLSSHFSLPHPLTINLWLRPSTFGCNHAKHLHPKTGLEDCSMK